MIFNVTNWFDYIGPEDDLFSIPANQVPRETKTENKSATKPQIKSNSGGLFDESDDEDIFGSAVSKSVTVPCKLMYAMLNLTRVH